MLEKNGFEIVIASPPEYDNLVAEIYYNEKFVALVNQEGNLTRYELEFPGTDLLESEITRRVEWRDFKLTVDQACKRLSGDISV